MRISEMLESIASWLSSQDNEALMLSEYDEKCMEIVARANVEAAQILRLAAEEVEGIEPPTESLITPDSIEQVAGLATALDASGDTDLQKTASVLDELLLTIAAPKDAAKDMKVAADERIESLKQKYNDIGRKIKEYNKTADQEKEVAKSEYLKNKPIQEHPLKTRYCPDHAGTSTYKLAGSDDVYICPLDNRSYNFREGYTLLNGDKVPGGSVAGQGHFRDNRFTAPMYDDRDGRLNFNK